MIKLFLITITLLFIFCAKQDIQCVGHVNMICSVCGTHIDNNAHITTNRFKNAFVYCPKCDACYFIKPYTAYKEPKIKDSNNE